MDVPLLRGAIGTFHPTHYFRIVLEIKWWHIKRTHDGIKYAAKHLTPLTKLWLNERNPLQDDNFGLLLGWVDFVLVVALSARKGGNLAEHLDTMVEHPNQSQPKHVTNPVFQLRPESASRALHGAHSHVHLYTLRCLLEHQCHVARLLSSARF